MNSQKYENMLNLALDIGESERQKTQTLNVGFDDVNKTWDVIVRYNQNIDFLKDQGVKIVYLVSNYAILNVPEQVLNTLNTYPEIIFVEMPKNLYLTVNNGTRVSCIDEVQISSFSTRGGLFGKGVICAVIDSGIDYYNDVFRNADGTTRILELWDQNAQGNPPEGYDLGSVYTREQINEALNTGSQDRAYELVPSRDLSGHGTHVAGIMAGNFAPNRNDDLGIATRSDLIIVKLNTTINNGFPRTTELMQAINYAYQAGLRYNMPVSMNLSFGNSYGSHDGTSLIETFIDDISNLSKMAICIGTGNEGSSAGHTKMKIKSDSQDTVQFSVGNYEGNLNIQIWKMYADQMTFYISAPGGNNTVRIDNVSGTARSRLGNDSILVYYGVPSPYSPFQEIYIEIIPYSLEKAYITSGIWSISAQAGNVINGRVDMWLPDSAALNTETRFITPDPDVTLTIPSTSSSCISVGGYNSLTFAYADFSGRGFTRLTNQVRPDIVAPAINVTSAAVGGGMTEKSGTSMATPFVSGSAALLMEWGIIRGNDPYLYGEKLKAYLIKGAKPLPGFTKYPNTQVGDCVKLVLG